jgi:PadR family transcriptional regulator, regulatory protein PadR
MAASPVPRMTLPTQLVLRALVNDPTREMYGLEICALAGLPSGTIHPILARLEAVGWLESRWEEIDPKAEGRPRRRYYRLSPDGLEFSRDALARAHETTARLQKFRPAAGGV